MIEKYYSKIQEGKLLHLIYRSDPLITEVRQDIVESQNFIQCSFLAMNKGKTFRPHKHITKERAYKEQIAQESWIVIKGSVKCVFYDIDDTILATPILNAGDASFTLAAGHNYEILENGTVVYEYKTGPYEGQIFDKVFLK
jgi:cupin fold WbuC family metalloprotein